MRTSFTFVAPVSVVISGSAIKSIEGVEAAVSGCVRPLTEAQMPSATVVGNVCLP